MWVAMDKHFLFFARRQTAALFLLLTITTSLHSNYASAFSPPQRVLFARPSPPIITIRDHTFSSSSASPDSHHKSSASVIISDYWNAIRPYTILQAVGALVVGRLALVAGQNTTPARPGPLLAAAASVYLSYGAGMAMNDCADVDADALHENKQDQAIASGRISKRAGWTYCLALSLASLFFASRVGTVYYSLWTASNLALMLGYALGLQRLFLVKNIVCGWLAISPLVGAALLSSSGGGVLVVSPPSSKLWRLAVVGFPVQVAREILKDIEDVDIDEGNKRTLPLVVGEAVAHRIAYALVGAVCSAMVLTPSYWSMFASNPPVYAIGLLAGVSMCIRASMLPLKKGEKLLKKSIYVLLAGMIGGLLVQQQ
jgi:4-hydroxybenzoate polyprenyltransferase